MEEICKVLSIDYEKSGWKTTNLNKLTMSYFFIKKISKVIPGKSGKTTQTDQDTDQS